MAPAISRGSAATALSILMLAVSNIGMWLRIADVAPNQLSEPEPTLGQLQGKLGQLEGAVVAQQDTIAQLGVRTARCEALLKPLEESKPGQSGPDATNLTSRSIGKNTTINTTADEPARSNSDQGETQSSFPLL